MCGSGMAKEPVDLGVGEKETLRPLQSSKAALLPFLVSRRSVALLNEVILASSSRDGDLFRCA